MGGLQSDIHWDIFINICDIEPLHTDICAWNMDAWVHDHHCQIDERGAKVLCEEVMPQPTGEISGSVYLLKRI